MINKGVKTMNERIKLNDQINNNIKMIIKRLIIENNNKVNTSAESGKLNNLINYLINSKNDLTLLDINNLFNIFDCDIEIIIKSNNNTVESGFNKELDKAINLIKVNKFIKTAEETTELIKKYQNIKTNIKSIDDIKITNEELKEYKEKLKNKDQEFKNDNKKLFNEDDKILYKEIGYTKQELIKFYYAGRMWLLNDIIKDETYSNNEDKRLFKFIMISKVLEILDEGLKEETEKYYKADQVY